MQSQEKKNSQLVISLVFSINIELHTKKNLLNLSTTLNLIRTDSSEHRIRYTLYNKMY